MKFVVKEGVGLGMSQLQSLYEDAGWASCASQPEKVLSALSNSSLVLTAWLGDELVGLVRLLSDGHFITYIQDILVKKQYKRNGIGRRLLKQALEQAGQVRQIVLLTDDNDETRGFYEALGFFSCDRGDLVSFARMNL